MDDFGQFAEEGNVGLAFRLLVGGTYRIGMSSHEIEAAKRLAVQPNISMTEVTPVTDVKVATAFVEDRPLSVRAARSLGLEVSGPEGHPAMLTRGEALALAELLGCRLPSEAEWETCCRAQSTSLFLWGDDLPPLAQLESWLAWEIESPALKRNRHGFGGLFFGEWCAEEFRVSHAPDADVIPGVHVVKGGGAQFWPWQDEEWVWCAPAMRMRSTGLFDDQRGAVRLVLDLPS